MKLSKSDKIDKEQEALDKYRLAHQRKSEHFEPGTVVVYKGKQYLLLCYRHTDGRMILDNKDETLDLTTYSMQWRSNAS